MKDEGSARFVVEVSNEREMYSVAPYERWELGTEEELADRLRLETGWHPLEAESAASDVALGLDFEDTDDETGKTVHAYVEQKAVAAR